MVFKVIAYLFSYAMAISGYFIVYNTNNLPAQMRGIASIMLGIFLAIIVVIEEINDNKNKDEKYGG